MVNGVCSNCTGFINVQTGDCLSTCNSTNSSSQNSTRSAEAAFSPKELRALTEALEKDLSSELGAREAPLDHADLETKGDSSLAEESLAQIDQLSLELLQSLKVSAGAPSIENKLPVMDMLVLLEQN